jgi:spore coat polysaccharide biosynthesis protein SpsF (cytidylyltransferase family)
LQASDLSARHREHVTLAVVDGTIPALTYACIAPKELAYPKLRFDVDQIQDLEYLESLLERHHIELATRAEEIVQRIDSGLT